MGANIPTWERHERSEMTAESSLPKQRPKITFTRLSTLPTTKHEGYSQDEFATYKKAMSSFDGVCFVAIDLFFQKKLHQGKMPIGLKTSLAKKILLHHPEKSLQSARNLISIASKLQEYYSAYIDIYCQKNASSQKLKDGALAHLTARLKKDMKETGYTENLVEIGSYLTMYRSYIKASETLP